MQGNALAIFSDPDDFEGARAGEGNSVLLVTGRAFRSQDYYGHVASHPPIRCCRPDVARPENSLPPRCIMRGEIEPRAACRSCWEFLCRWPRRMPGALTVSTATTHSSSRRRATSGCEKEAALGAKSCIDLVHQRRSRWQFERGNLPVRNFAQVLHETPQAVAVRNDQHTFAPLECRGNRIMPVPAEHVRPCL